MNPLITMDLTHWNEKPLPGVAAAATDALEDGRVLFMPGLAFDLMAGEERLLEQTFYLPATAMRDENKAPLRVLEQLMQRALA